MTTVKMNNKHFQKGVKYAKKVGGKFNPGSKTWTLPDTAEVERMLGAAGAYGWVVVNAPQVSEDSELGIDDPAFWS